MKKFGALILLLFVGMSSASAQTNTFTFTNTSGTLYSNLVVVAIEPDDVLFRFGHLGDWQYTRVQFTNMPVSVQAQFGYDPEKIRKENEERQAEDDAELKALHERIIAEEKAARFDSIQKYKDEFSLYAFDESDFPNTEAARQSCKEIVSELKGISKALELGCSFNKFSDLLTDKVLSVEKIKDLQGEGIPQDFLRHVNDCVDAYKESKHWWNEKIQAEYPELEKFDENCMRDYWSEADLHLICCSGIAESNTNAISLVIDKMAEMIKDQQDSVKDGILEAKGNYDPNVSDLTVEEISAKLKAALSITNTPSTTQQK